jgi:signal transduction histidine kinase
MYTKTITKQAIKKELSLIYKQYSESVDIQSTSTRLLNFLVNDMLDFASVQSGKFRKECSNFNIKESIMEIMLILQFKADQFGITVNLDLKNFRKVKH